MTYVYVASSWRCQHQPLVVKMLRGVGAAAGMAEPEFGVYDFRDSEGFTWSQVDPEWSQDVNDRTIVDRERYLKMVDHPRARQGFARDMQALDRANAVLLVMPCGRSAHLELGYAVGKAVAGLRVKTAVYLPEDTEPDLMWAMADRIIIDPTDLMEWANGVFTTRLRSSYREARSVMYGLCVCGHSIEEHDPDCDECDCVRYEEES